MSARLARQVGMVVLAAVLASCATTTSAKDVFGSEPLATGDFAGLEVLKEHWSDGTSGNLATGKSSRATVTRMFIADGAPLSDGFAELTAAASSSGWTTDEDLSNAETLWAVKKFAPGVAQLLIHIYPQGDLSGDGRPYILLQLTV